MFYIGGTWFQESGTGAEGRGTVFENFACLGGSGGVCGVKAGFPGRILTWNFSWCLFAYRSD